MKYLIFILSILLSVPGLSQIDKFTSTYKKIIEGSNYIVFEVVLRLKPDGAFFCSFYQNQQDYMDDDKGRGKWIFKKEEIWFSADKLKDVNKKFTLNFY